MELDAAKNHSLPLYKVVADTLRAKIEAGVHAVDGKLPAQEVLMEDFAVSRSTIRLALKELQRERYINSIQGSGSYVLRRESASAPERSYGLADALLSAHLAKAFTAAHVKIDVYSLTAETLNQAIGQILIQIRNGVIRPESITIRVIIAASDESLLVGQPVTDTADSRTRQRTSGLVRNQVSILRHSFVSIHEVVPKVSVTIKALAATPLFKLYLLNGTELLHGYYKFAEEDVEVDEETKETVRAYDTYGLRSTLFHYSSVGVAEDSGPAVLLRETQLWFESLWTTVARQPRLSE
ncbi:MULTISPECIES: GntR family transcriptional regulator [unclassified Streptomyces]|uniref:GntR family transcriptional regulator n=1 Tax=unclassified Streptomyces TaxID=2593676 RepID=UPI0013704092|nr:MULTISPECIES: GntR family transcriptional regulator [unclassified Streptomyces]MYS22620.1 GntR family transcriptional regulator [Streptomyces sp. SID4948]